MITEPTSPRRSVYFLLIAMATAMVASNIVGAQRVYEPYLYKPDRWPKERPEPWPTHGDNDRSRWATVRALVDHGTFAIGKRTFDEKLEKGYEDTGICTEDGWKTIDKVLHPDLHEFYSSKPPLLPVIAAGEYWALKRLFGWSITDPNQRWLVMRTILLTLNGIPFCLYLVLLSSMLERYGNTDWGRYLVLATACFGTFANVFNTTFNNHTIATYAALFTIYCAARAFEEGNAWKWFFLSGFAAGFTACNELPAASMAALTLFVLLFRNWRLALLGFVPGVALMVVGFEAANYAAVGEWVPAYEKFGGPWYEFEGSYWKQAPNRIGIDWIHQRQSRAVYAFHVLVGHHGWLSLAPINLLALAGMIYGLSKLRTAWPAALALLLTAVVIGFYTVWVNDRARNYGGWTNGLRWLMWLTPCWLLSMLPIADKLSQTRLGRALGCLLLALSVFSASYRPWSPWRMPWLYNLMEYLGWISYETLD